MATPDQKKSMSSRLLTMKFMQRASATPTSSPSTPIGSSGSKRIRLSSDSTVAAPRSGAEAVEEALAAEDQQRTEAMEREGAARGETKWYLSFQQPSTAVEKSAPFRIVSAGYSSLDTVGDEPDETNDEANVDSPMSHLSGRRSFGRFNRQVEKQQDSHVSSSESSDDDSDVDASGQDDEDPNGAKALISKARQEAVLKAKTDRGAKRKSGQAKLQEFAEQRRSKQIKLNNMQHVIGALRGPTCFNCQKQGHIASECAEPRQNRHDHRDTNRESQSRPSDRPRLHY